MRYIVLLLMVISLFSINTVVSGENKDKTPDSTQVDKKIESNSQKKDATDNISETSSDVQDITSEQRFMKNIIKIAIAIVIFGFLVGLLASLPAVGGFFTGMFNLLIVISAILAVITMFSGGFTFGLKYFCAVTLAFLFGGGVGFYISKELKR